MARLPIALALLLCISSTSCSNGEDDEMKLDHDATSGLDITISHSPDPAFLFIADPDTYEGFLSSNWTIEELWPHVTKQIRDERIAAWGTPEQDLTIRIIVRNYYDLDPPSPEFAAATAFYVQSQGRLCFGSYTHITMSAQFRDSTIDSDTNDHPDYSRHIISVRPGRYCVEVFRHFGWYEGLQHAEQLNDGVNFTIVISYHATGNRIPHYDIPWTTIPTPPMSPDEIERAQNKSE